MILSASIRICPAIALIAACITSPLRAQDSAPRSGGQIPPEVETIYERGLTWLAAKPTERATGRTATVAAAHGYLPDVIPRQRTSATANCKL